VNNMILTSRLERYAMWILDGLPPPQGVRSTVRNDWSNALWFCWSIQVVTVP